MFFLWGMEEIMNLSNCCFSPILENSDICSKCKEHCSETEGEE
jgi:hypothetical protein